MACLCSLKKKRRRRNSKCQINLPFCCKTPQGRHSVTACYGVISVFKMLFLAPPPSLLFKPLLPSALPGSCFSRFTYQVKESSVCIFHWSPERLNGKIKDSEPARGRAKAQRLVYHPGLGWLVIALLSETLAETGVLTAFIVTIKNINGPRTQKANEEFS